MHLAHSAAAAAGLSLLVSLAACASTVAPAGSSPARRTAPAGVIETDFQQVRGANPEPRTTTFCLRHFKIACYQARQVERAYSLPALYARHVTGRGQTIVIVDSFGSPTVRHDLTVFDRAEHLPAPPSLKIIRPVGKVAPYRPGFIREVWAGVTNLDVQYAHAIAPGAKILLVETPTSQNEGRAGFPQIVRAEKFVINHHLGGVISQSFNTTEQDFTTAQELLRLRGAYVDAAKSGVTVLASSGESGAADVRLDGFTYFLHPVNSWPDSDPLVTATGGTQLHLNAAGDAVSPPTIWNDTFSVPTNEYFAGSKDPSPLASGGGKSIIFARPRYQNGVARTVGIQRAVPDISMTAACNGADQVYQSFRGQPAGWYLDCGTSEAAPEFAGIVALADQMAGHPLGLINPYLYRLSAHHAPGIIDITKGNNTVTFRQKGAFHTVKGFSTKPGYDLATGVGTVNARFFVPELACMATHPHWSWARIAATPRCQAA
jgi:subtilase family serine protease